jgi:hypothetical protein
MRTVVFSQKINLQFLMCLTESGQWFAADVGKTAATRPDVTEL